MRWYLAHDPEPLPHLFRVLWLFWVLRDHLGEARAWVDQLLPAADSLDARARAELLWTAAATANEVGDDAAALAAGERLAPLLDGIDDPFLHAVSQLAMAWISPIVDDFDGALREASVAPGAAPRPGRAVLDSGGRVHRSASRRWPSAATTTPSAT